MTKHQNQIEKLITKLCPEGVAFKELGEVTDYSKTRIAATELSNTNYVGVDNLLPNKQGKTLSNYVPTTGKLTHFEAGDILLGNIRPYLKKVWRATHSGGTNGDVLVIRINESEKEGLDSEYLYYILSSDSFFSFDMKFSKGAKMPRGNKTAIKKFKIPLPSIAVQKAIVKILDTFTTLEAELEAELEARKKQYEYYREELLTFGDDVEWKTLSEVCEMKAGKSISASDISSLRSENNVYPCIGGNGLRGYVDSFSHSGKFPIIGRQGALCGNVCFAEGDFYATEHAVVVKCGEQFTARFLYHLLLLMNLNQYATGGAQPGLAVSKLEKIKIPTPCLDEQERIVAILDKFDALVNDISVGLPAELSARRQQYEYYREKLLTFKPL